MVAIFLLFILSPAHDGAVSYFYLYASFCALTTKRSWFLREEGVFVRIIVLIWPLCRPVMFHSSLMISIIRREWSVWDFCQQSQRLTLPLHAPTLTKHLSGTDQLLKNEKEKRLLSSRRFSFSFFSLSLPEHHFPTRNLQALLRDAICVQSPWLHAACSFTARRKWTCSRCRVKCALS